MLVTVFWIVDLLQSAVLQNCGVCVAVELTLRQTGVFLSWTCFSQVYVAFATKGSFGLSPRGTKRQQHS